MHKLTRLWAPAAIAVVAASSTGLAAGPTETVGREKRVVVVAPTTKVTTTPERTRVRVAAPYTSVKVDTEARHVRIRVPYYSGDIRW